MGQLFEDTLRINIKDTNSTSGGNANKPKNYGEYLDQRVQSAQQNRVNFAKADPAKLQTMAKNYATVASTKFKNLQGLPKNDSEANNMLKTSIEKNAMEKSADGKDTRESEEAEKEIEELQKTLVESQIGQLSPAAVRMLSHLDEAKKEHAQTAGIFVVNKQDEEFLVCHMTPVYQITKYGKASKKNGWGLPKGHVEPGEDLAETAIREVEEETSLKFERDDLRYIGNFKYSNEKDLAVFVVEVEEPIDFYVKSCKCQSTFEFMGKTWNENDGFASYCYGDSKPVVINLHKQLDAILPQILERV